jgi:hypothetical protein
MTVQETSKVKDGHFGGASDLTQNDPILVWSFWRLVTLVQEREVLFPNIFILSCYCYQVTIRVISGYVNFNLFRVLITCG